MKIMGFVKRFLPFLAAFAVGVFITSFFVDLSRPRFGFRGNFHGERFRYCERMRIENGQASADFERLANENLRLRNALRRLDPSAEELQDDFSTYPDVKDIPSTVTQPIPLAPPAPRAHR